uniref:Retrovirus-related Pol polyprotein from transposon opus n=1 Tax=Cajanus cajan TaxID=3821 RepID=A0A151SXS9_CAJCA|nr:Retrovirus-related Pol polyprotein from transposon opus [Cajanus cajan]
MVVIRYLVVDAQSSYSILIGRPTLNKLGAIVSTSHLKVKYPLPSGAVGVLKVDQEVARKCYGDSLKARRRLYTKQVEKEVHSVKLDPRMGQFDHRPAPAEDVKEVEVMEGRNVKIGTSLTLEDKEKLVSVLKDNVSAFAWHSSDMPRLMEKVLVNQLGRNVEAYVYDMVVKSESVSRHFGDLQELFDTIGKYQLKMNPEKCSFGVQAGKFLSFLLTHRGIEANPDKCSVIINMRSPSTVKEVQQLTGRMASLSRFLSRAARIKKLALAILVTVRNLRHYFQSYEVIIRTNHPMRQVLQKPDLAGQMMKWSVELSEFSIKYEPRGAIKAQAGAGIVLEGSGGILLEQSLRFEFRANNNRAEYEALLAGMALAKEMGATSLSARSDSQLITGQVAGTFQAKDPQLDRYLEKVKLLSENFREFTLNHVPREQNLRADLLSKLASTRKPGATWSVIQETLSQPSINFQCWLRTLLGNKVDKL